MGSITNYETIARAIIDQTGNNSNELNLETVLQVIDTIENFTGCKLYNKVQLTNQLVELSEDNFTSEARKAILSNLIPQVDFNSLFKSDMEFTLVFKEDDVVVLYKNNPVTMENLEQIKLNLVKNSIKDFPSITELYVDNIVGVISKFINKDISVQYYCANIPLPYWKLFEIKCRKANSTTQAINDKCKELEKIISGQYFNVVKSNNIQVIGQVPTPDDEELKAVLMQIEEYEGKNKNSNTDNNSSNINNMSDNEKNALEDVYRMEVMSYLNDNEIMIFLDSLEKIDGFEKDGQYSDKEFITKYMKYLLELSSTMQNKIAKFYCVYKVYSLINSVPWFIDQHENLRTSVTNKVNEFTDELYILQSAELKLYHGVSSTMDKTKEIIDSIEKKLNPNYVPKWKNNNQQIILNQIINNNNLNNNNIINYNNSNKIILEDSDDDINVDSDNDNYAYDKDNADDDDEQDW
jgi:hypothetical protein